jgi:hypothetical protein
MKSRVAGGEKLVAEKQDQSCLHKQTASDNKTSTPPMDAETIESLFLGHLGRQNAYSFGDSSHSEPSAPYSSPDDMHKHTSIAQVDFLDVFTASSESSSMMGGISEPPSIAPVDFDFQSYLDQCSLPDQTFDASSNDSFFDTRDLNFDNIQSPNRLAPTKLVPSLLEKDFSPSAMQASLYPKDRGSLASAIIQQLRLDDTKENLALVKTSIARGHNIHDVFLAGLSALGREDRQAAAPSPHSDRLLTLVPLLTLQAYISIAIKVGYSSGDLHDQDMKTHFYQRNTSFNAILASVENIPLQLRPTMSQIMYPHPPWMDLLPFPVLRERAVMMQVANSSAIDMDELKDDLYLRNGLICWRSGHKGGSGHAWDYRNWEAEPWFLKK